MLDAQLRGVKERVLEPLAQTTGERVHPTTITLVGGAVGVACAVSVGFGFYGLGVLLWLLNRTLDGLDGTVARLYDHQSDLGAYVDIMVDFVVYALVPIALVVSQPSALNAVMLVFLLTTFYINTASWMYLSAILERRRQGASARGELTSVTMPTGWIEGSETVAFYTLFLIMPSHVAVLFGLMGLAVMLTIGQRVIWAYKTFD